MAASPDKNSRDVVLKQDYIKVRGTFKKWQTKFFVLRPERLDYYKDNNLSKGPEGTIDLTDTEVLVRESKKKGFCFKLRNVKGVAIAHGAAFRGVDNLILRTTLQSHGQAWMELIVEARDYFKLPKDRNRSSVKFAEKPHHFEEDKRSGSSTFSDTEDPSDDISDDVVDERALLQVEPEEDVPVPVEGTEYEEVPLFLGLRQSGSGEKAGNLVISLIKQLGFGVDLSKIALPTFILEPRSYLEKMTDFLGHIELVENLTNIEDPLERMIGVVRWYISGFYIRPAGVKKPYNPILGEVFRAKWKHPSSNTETHFIGEQVSHHPPVSAFYAANRQLGFVVDGIQQFGSKFMGTYADVIVKGTGTLHLLVRNESYTFDFPNGRIKGFFSTLRDDLCGDVAIRCPDTGLQTNLKFKTNDWGQDFSRLEGEVVRTSDNAVLRKIKGYWDTEVFIGTEKPNELLWSPDGKSKDRLPMYMPPMDKMDRWESRRLWDEVTKAIVAEDQTVASEGKNKLEEEQRQAKRERDAMGVEVVHKHFNKTEDGAWKYKYLNYKPWDPNTEDEQYEKDFVIATRKKVKAPSTTAAKTLAAPKERTRKMSGDRSSRREEKAAAAAAPLAATTATASNGEVDEKMKKDVAHITKAVVALLEKSADFHAKQKKTSQKILVVCVLLLLLQLYVMWTTTPAIAGAAAPGRDL